MTPNQAWQVDFERELEGARAARQAGNEGRARVCARRAAGIVVGEFLRRRGIAVENLNAYQRLSALGEASNLPPRVTEIARHLTLRLAPDYRLPVEADLVAEAQELRALLLGD